MADDAARAASAEFAYCELLLSGVTSLVDISPSWDGWIDLLAKSGLRGFLAPGYASARWRLDNVSSSNTPGTRLAGAMGSLRHWH